MSDVFIVGAPRSGTSWLRTLLAGHPDLASPHELHLFSRYLAPIETTWRGEQADLGRRRMAGLNDAAGLTSLLEEEEIHAWMRDLYRRARVAAIERKPGATRLLEKTPGHALHLDLIRRVVPEARFLHLVRDPRDVIASMLERARRPLGDWAPRDVARATSSWCHHVGAALGAERPEDTLQVRYERLHADPIATLAVIASFLALEGTVADWVAGDPTEPAFVRAAAVTVQRDPGRGDPSAPLEAGNRSLAEAIGAPTETGLPRSARWYVESVCAREMAELGYGAPTQSGDPPRVVRALLGRATVRGRSLLAQLVRRGTGAGRSRADHSDRSRRASAT